MSMYSIFSFNMDLQSVSPVTTIEDAIDDMASPSDHQEQPHADKQGISYQDDENDHFPSPMEQRRLSLTDLQNEAIYAFGTRLSVITEVSKEDSSNQVMTIHPSPTTREEKESNDEAFQHGGSDESVASSDESVVGVPRRCSSEPSLAEALDRDNMKNLRDILCKSLDRLELSNLHLTESDLKDIYNACPRLTHFSVGDCTLDRDVLLQFLPQSLRVLDLSNNVWVTDLWLVDLLRQHHFKSDQLVHVFVANCASISRQSIARLNLEYQGRVRIIRSKTTNV